MQPDHLVTAGDVLQDLQLVQQVVRQLHVGDTLVVVGVLVLVVMMVLVVLAVVLVQVGLMVLVVVVDVFC